MWGAATSAYQVEGAWDADGKGPGIWDLFCRRPGAIEHGDSGEIACDHYHRWRDDVALMAVFWQVDPVLVARGVKGVTYNGTSNIFQWDKE